MSQPVFEISRSGMDVEYRRLEVVAHNIANAGTTRTAEGQPYAPVRLISGPKYLSARMAAAPTALTPGAAGATMKGTAAAVQAALPGVQAYGVERLNAAPRQVYEPSHPHADAKGYVSYPAVDQLSEMTTLMKAVRAYEANVAVFNATRSMYLKALDLGGKS